jgi:hypothetical protein
MNKVLKIFSDLTDEQLREVLLEMKEDNQKGYIRTDGWIRKLNQEVCETIGEDTLSVHLHQTQINVYREAAIRYLEQDER